jgi:23S rRNA G2069 N7-methylase RlmK/C1962 C5-methylase RlmI
MSAKNALQAEMLANRLRKRHRHLRKWARRTGVGAYRLYDRDIPEIPLLLDLYLPAAETAAEPALCGSLYRRPYEKDPAEEALWLSAMKTAAAEALAMPPERIFFRERKRLRDGERYETGNSPGTAAPDGRAARVTLDSGEGGFVFRVNLTDHLDTGLFPDRRLLRARVREEARGKRILNLFAYTCSFSVYAAAGGAASIDSVDMSTTYLTWGMANFSRNGFIGEKRTAIPEAGTGTNRGGPYRFITADVLRFLPLARNMGLRWDLIILDPPVFSNSARMDGTLDIRRDQRELLDQCLALLAPGGKCYFSVNARGFKLDGGAFPGVKTADITEKLRDEDFKGKKIPSCYIFEK